MFIIYGLILSFQYSQPQDKPTFTPADNPLGIVKNQSLEIIVDVEGSIVKPGVYKLLENARIQEALIKSGGYSSQTDRDWASSRNRNSEPFKKT